MLLALLLVLAQADDQPAAAPPAEPAKAPASTESAEPSKPAVVPQGNLTNEIERVRRHSKDPVEAAEAASDLVHRVRPLDPEELRRAANAPVVVPDVKDYASMPEVDQVRYSAREFFTQLLAGDARAIVSSCGFPFQLEERRLQTPDELFQEWLRNLRAKRTDLLTLYDIEVLTPSDMEKKYGRPPARLANLPWRNPKTYVAVANLSGHAAVAVLRQSGPAWAVVGYSD